MAKTTKNTRILMLMEKCRWQGINNWRQLREELQSGAIPEFKDWMLKHLKYIEPQDAREALQTWILEGDSGTAGQAFYIKKDRGESVLIGLSLYQQGSK